MRDPHYGLMLVRCGCGRWAPAAPARGHPLVRGGVRLRRLIAALGLMALQIGMIGGLSVLSALFGRGLIIELAECAVLPPEAFNVLPRSADLLTRPLADRWAYWRQSSGFFPIVVWLGGAVALGAWARLALGHLSVSARVGLLTCVLLVCSLWQECAVVLGLMTTRGDAGVGAGLGGGLGGGGIIRGVAINPGEVGAAALMAALTALVSFVGVPVGLLGLGLLGEGLSMLRGWRLRRARRRRTT